MLKNDVLFIVWKNNKILIIIYDKIKLNIIPQKWYLYSIQNVRTNHVPEIVHVNSLFYRLYNNSAEYLFLRVKNLDLNKKNKIKYCSSISNLSREYNNTNEILLNNRQNINESI